MGRCDVCGNDYEKTMVITTPDQIGHGVEAPDGRYFCCAHRAEQAGVPERKVNA